MKIKEILLFFAGLLIVLHPLYSQQVNIRGKVLDTITRAPIEFANVSLLKHDSTFVLGINSDKEGVFDMTTITIGDYLLSTSSIGYKTLYTPLRLSETNYSIELLLAPSSILLDEITVAINSTINKGDRKLIFPSLLQIRTSTDGLDLLQKMQLPHILIDPITNEVSASGNGAVQLRINGVEVTNVEITALQPGDVVRIEYHDDPGARYGNVAAVIDYITRRKESGGTVRGSFMNNIGGNKTSADDLVSMKFNNQKSEFSVNASYQHRKQDWTREYDELLVFPDHELHRLEVGEPTPFDKKRLYSNFNYSLVKKDNFFNAQFRYNFYDFPSAYEDRRSRIITSDADTPLSIFDHSTEKSNSPALDLYFQRSLKNSQLLIFNVVGTFIKSESTRLYQEQRDDVVETDIHSNISGKKYSLIAEGIYERKLGAGRLTSGLKYLQLYANNEYKGTTVADISMKQMENNAYLEYQFKSGKWGYMTNLTAICFYYSQDNNNRVKYTVQPAARLTYNPNGNTYFRYRIHLMNNMPSLAFLNNVEQIIDPLQVRRGNPSLSSFQTLSQGLSAGYNKGRLGVDLLLTYDYQYKPIMESVLYEDGLLVRTYENQTSFQNLGAEVTLKLKLWKNFISMAVTPRVNRFISEGNNYLHTYTMKEIRVNLDVSYKNYVANFTTITPYRSMYGEQLTLSEQMYTIMAGYKRPNWSIMFGALSPFTKTYKSENENWATLNPVRSEIHTTNMTQMFFVKFGFNLNFGKQFKDGNRRINNSDNDSGIMSGAKN